MRIAWFTPLSQQSAIGRFSVIVAESLSRMADVDLCCFDTGNIRQTPVATRKFDFAESISAATMSRYDMAVYNFGNHLPFHREIYFLSRRWPGICVLHDFVMHHFFAAYYLEYLKSESGYNSLLQRTYGDALPSIERVWETADVVNYPLFEEATRGALGVVAHSEFLKKRVGECFGGPVTKLSLAYDACPANPELCRSQLDLAADQTLIVTVGHVNPNKQIESMLQALAQAGPMQSYIYAIIGTASAAYERKLKSAVDKLGLGRSVRFLGEVSDQLLRTYLSAADICINLRFPSMEGASASVIEEMLFGKPVIVTDTGFFSELPDDCVIKTRAGSVDDLVSAISKLVNDESARKGVGSRARVFAQSEFHPDRYAKSLLDFIWETQSAQPILGLADRVAFELARMGADSETKLLGVAAREIEHTFVPKSSIL